MQLKNAKVLVTGGSDGYGRGIAAVLKKAGAEVWITGRNIEKLEKAAEELGVRTIQADASSGADWDRVMRETGELDVLVNNAGFGGKIVPVAEQTDEDIIRTIGTNLTGVVLGCRRAGAMMAKRKRGIIINISSVCALYAWPAWSVYTAAKAGVAKFSHGLYTELRPHGVRVSCVTPSWGQTGFNHAANISGASENPELAAKCIAPEELGNIVRSIIEQPDHLAVPDITVQPVIQDISPM
ncbi:MAG: SDR family oxidoreductase [Victivallales bacterium]|nr:SDR family oxidoreductase [bacterium]MDY5696303.1 SDR family oxidoreductase [Victivallales bacterium]